MLQMFLVKLKYCSLIDADGEEQRKSLHRMAQKFYKISLQVKKRNHICNFAILNCVHIDVKNSFPCPYKLISLPNKSFKANFKFFEPQFIRKTFLQTLKLRISERLLYVFSYFIQYRKNLFKLILRSFLRILVKRDLSNIYFFENLIHLFFLYL